LSAVLVTDLRSCLNASNRSRRDRPGQQPAPHTQAGISTIGSGLFTQVTRAALVTAMASAKRSRSGLQRSGATRSTEGCSLQWRIFLANWWTILVKIYLTTPSAYAII